MNFRDEMLAEMKRQGLSMAELSRRANVTYDVVRDLSRRDGSTTSTENAERIRVALGLLPARAIADETAPSDARLVPVYDIEASAGPGAVVDGETVTHTLAFPPDYLRSITSTDPRHLAIIAVKGDSMVPTLSEDDIVMVDLSKRNHGYEGLFVIRIFDVLHVKRLSHSRPGFIMVISDNRDVYPPREYAAGDIEVVGKVLWAGGKM